MTDPAGALYTAIVRARGALFDHNLRPSYLTPPLVVSIGNIETGGTGKTPLTIALATALKERGHRVAVVTRGYRGKAVGTLEVRPDHDPAQVGDEALLIRQRTGVAVIKSPDRVAGAMYAARELGSQIVLLDDGFQHRRLRRDLDIVLVSPRAAQARSLPTGSLRESLAALARADIIVNTKGATPLSPYHITTNAAVPAGTERKACRGNPAGENMAGNDTAGDSAFRGDSCTSLAPGEEASVRLPHNATTPPDPNGDAQGFRAELVPEGLVDLAGELHPLELLQNRPVLACCGIARPAPFFETLRTLGAKLETITWRDHHRYTARDIAKIRRAAGDCELVLTTEKDLVKLVPAGLTPATVRKPWYALRVQMQLDGLERIIEEIERRAADRRISR